tara:strand:+ start:506 stop:646 length:141 start_codon:yes stop_codon:yes gene_type:complete
MKPITDIRKDMNNIKLKTMLETSNKKIEKIKENEIPIPPVKAVASA